MKELYPKYDFKKTLKTGLVGGIFASIFGGGAIATQTGASVESAIMTLVSFAGGFLFTAFKNYLKNY